MFNAEGQKICVSGSVHGWNQHLSDLFLLTLLTFNEVIPVVPSSSGLELKEDIIAAHGIRHWNIKLAHRLGDWAAFIFPT